MARCVKILIAVCFFAIIEDGSLNDPLCPKIIFQAWKDIQNSVMCSFNICSLAIEPMAELGMNDTSYLGGKRKCEGWRGFQTAYEGKWRNKVLFSPET